MVAFIQHVSEDWQEITASGETCCTQTSTRTTGDSQEAMDIAMVT